MSTRRTGSYTCFLNAGPHNSVLKASKCTMYCYWYMANPSKENFQDWWDTAKGITCCAPTGVIVQVLEIENIPGGARTHFFSMPFGSLPANIKQCGVMPAWLSAAFLWDQSLVAEHHLPSHPASKCCQPHFIATIMRLMTFIMLQLCVCPFTRRYIYNANEQFHTDNTRLRAILIFT